jgi:ParB-like nuclease domain/DNA methylase
MTEKGRLGDGLHAALKGRGRARRNALAKHAAASDLRPPVRNDLLPALRIEQVPLEILRAHPRRLRKSDDAHIRTIANSISALGFAVPILVGENNVVLDGDSRLGAAKLLGLPTCPCIRVDHLDQNEQRVLRLAVNRLAEKGQWDLDELKIEFEELILAEAPIEIAGFGLDEIDQIVIGEEAEGLEQGPLAPVPGGVAVARLGDMFQVGPHRLICGDATDPAVLARLMAGDPLARLILTDEPYNVKIAGNVTGGAHREFAMASGEMSDVEFLDFNIRWIEAASAHLCDGGVFGTFIDWRGLPTVHSAATTLGLDPLNLIVWGKTNAGMGSLYRSQHELLPLFKKGDAPTVNNVALGKRGRWRSNLWTYPGASSMGSDARRGLQDHPTANPPPCCRMPSLTSPTAATLSWTRSSVPAPP